MRKPIEYCPACEGDLIVTQQTCTRCGTSIVGQFQPNIFSRLASEDLAFVEDFVRYKGNIKEMERGLGESYWTIRNQLNDVIESLGFEAKGEAPADAPHVKRQDVLAQLNSGELSVDEAAVLLKKLR